MRSGKKVIVSLLAVVFIFTCSPAWAASPYEAASEKYVAKADVEYAHSVALKLKDIVNSDLGGRNAGSDAEHKAADLLVDEMKAIGLQDVSKDAFPVTKWQFNGAELKIAKPADITKVIKPYSYASGNTLKEPNGVLSTELVYVGKGKKADYEGKNVKGKIVLVDINQRDEWWVTYPTLEAAYHGAKAIINNNVGGYAELDPTAMNCQDFCGPVTIPSVNVSKADADYLKGLLAKGKVSVDLKVDNVVENGGTSYNIVGRLPGKNYGTDKDEYIIVGDHYDKHFWGFQDNDCAVAITLAIAKGMVDAGYKPEHTLVFVLHGAEEYGAANTRYDWSTGAWNEINKVHPDWVGKALAYINFELPAYEFAKETHVASAVELYSFIKDYAKVAPKPQGVFSQGVLTEGYPQMSWSDDWSYTAAGVPSMVNGFLNKADGGGVYPFYLTHYHSQFDNVGTYNAKALDFNLKFYGAMALSLDNSPTIALDFTNQAKRVKDSVDLAMFRKAGIDSAGILADADKLDRTAAEKYAQLTEFNRLYAKLAEDPKKNADILARMQDIGRETNKNTLAIFKTCQDGLLKLTPEDMPILGHEQQQKNIKYLSSTIDKIGAGKLDDALDNDLWQVDNEWYAFSFSKPVCQHTTDYVVKDWAKNNLFWGTGKGQGDIDLYDTVQSLLGKYGAKKPDCRKEVKVLSNAVDQQKKLMVKNVAAERDTMNNAVKLLEKQDLSKINAEAKTAAGEY